jgi:cytochrome c biogenesis protein CcdA
LAGVSAQLVVLAVSIGLADSLNPSTLAPALVLSTSRRPRFQVAAFALGVFAVNLAGGAIVALGPGQLLLSLVPRPGATAKHVIELIAGVVLVTLGVLVLVRRDHLRNWRPVKSPERRRPGFLLGAGIAAVELPTAFPYFAVIAAAVGSDAGVSGQLLLLVLFNVAFLAPVLIILGVLTVAGARAAPVLARLRGWLENHWPAVVGALLIAAGLAAFGYALL